jgi:hypothetical protein
MKKKAQLPKHPTRPVLTVIMAIILVSGVSIGYSIGILKGTGAVRADVQPLAEMSTDELLDRSLSGQAEFKYVNPFEFVNEKIITYPINQLKRCRNWVECRQLCTMPDNFLSCSAWRNSL